MSLQILRPERGNQMLMNVDAMSSAHVLLLCGVIREALLRPCRYPSERVGGNLRPRRDPLPLAEQIGVAHRTVAQTVAAVATAPHPPIQPVHHRLAVLVDDP